MAPYIQQIETWVKVTFRSVTYDNYKVSNIGRFKSLGIHNDISNKNQYTHKEYIHLLNPIGNGRCRITLYHFGGNNVTVGLSQVIWESFNGPIKIGYIIDHKDDNPLNNHLSNLQMIIQAQNVFKYQNKPVDLIGINYRKRGNHETFNVKLPKFKDNKPIRNRKGTRLYHRIGSFKTIEEAIIAKKKFITDSKEDYSKWLS